MVRYEHPPICKAALDSKAHMDKLPAGFIGYPRHGGIWMGQFIQERHIYGGAVEFLIRLAATKRPMCLIAAEQG